MPKSHVVFYKDDDGTVPTLDWLDVIPSKVRAKCRAKIYRLAELGHELRRPEADLLRNNIYELRVAFQGVNYRMLYFFHGSTASVISHGIVKERVVPPVEIERAIVRKKKFESDPIRHSYSEEAE